MGGRISACFRNRRPRAPLAPPPPRAAACSPTRPAIRRVRQVRVGGSADARRSRRPRAGSVRWRAALPDGRPRPGGVRPPARPWPALPPGYAGCERGRPTAGSSCCRPPGLPSASPDELPGNRGGEPPRPHLPPRPRLPSLRIRHRLAGQGRTRSRTASTVLVCRRQRSVRRPWFYAGGRRPARDRRHPAACCAGRARWRTARSRCPSPGPRLSCPGPLSAPPRRQSLSVVVESPCVTVARLGMHPVCMFEGERSSQRAGGGYDKASGRTRLRAERARPDT